MPHLIDAPFENYSKVLGISKKEQNHSIHSVSCLINKALHILFFSISSWKETNDGNTITLSKDSDIIVEIWKGNIDL